MIIEIHNRDGTVEVYNFDTNYPGGCITSDVLKKMMAKPENLVKFEDVLPQLS